MVNFSFSNLDHIAILEAIHQDDGPNEIILLIGCTPYELHIRQYYSSLENVTVYCISNNEISMTSTDMNFNHINFNFNDKSAWNIIYRIFQDKVDKIIFDSSVAKFISDIEIWGFASNIYKLLRPNVGQLYYDSTDSGVSSVSIREGQLIMNLYLLPLINENSLEFLLKIERDTDHFNIIRRSDKYIDYLNCLQEEAKANGLLLYVNNNDNKSYPLQKTNFPIDAYLVIKRNGLNL